ncbi:MAG: PAS domain S-box protein, partial [Bacteroidetes bacterium]
ARLAKIGYWEYDFTTHCFTLSPKLFEKLEPGCFGSDQGTDVCMPLEKLLSKYTRHEEAVRIRNVLQIASRHQEEINYGLELEFRLVASNEQPLFVYTRGAIQKDGKLIGVAQDISELKKVQRNLTESELKFQNLVEQSLDAIVVVKDDGIITEWNPSAEAITGLSSEDVIDKYAWEIESSIIFNPSFNKQHPQQSPRKLEKKFFQFFHSSDARDPFVTEITIRNTSGKLLHLSVTSFVFSANQSKFLCRICKDITLEKQKQEQQKQEEILQKTAKAKELFLDNMSHEMRTPLSGIIGMTDILMHTRLSQPQEEMLKVVKESSDSLLELISKIHELSRLESDGMTILKKPFRIEAMMESSISIFKASALQKGIQLTAENQINHDGMFLGDEFRLRQVVGNLLANAIKFTPPGGKVELIAQGHASTEDGVEVKIQIKDTGIGVEKDKIPILFEKFTQADESYTREYDGLGIGLSISRELIRLMGGDIGVESEHLKGSTFWIKLTLPIVKGKS